MNNKLNELVESLPKNCCSFCTHLSLIGPDKDYKYEIKCVMLDATPKSSNCCSFFEPEYTKLTTYDLDNLYMNFLETCLRVNYDDYKKSIYWQLFKENTLFDNNHKCSICGSTANVDLIHINKNLGRETIDDVMSVCSECSSM